MLKKTLRLKLGLLAKKWWSISQACNWFRSRKWQPRCQLFHQWSKSLLWDWERYTCPYIFPAQAMRDRHNRETQTHCRAANDSKIRLLKERFETMFIITDFYHLFLARRKYAEPWGLQMNQKLETSSQWDLELSRVNFPKRGSFVDLSMTISDLG